MNHMLDIIRNLPANKTERDSYIRAGVDEILSGTTYCLDYEVALKRLEDIIEGIRKHPEVKHTMIAETFKYDKSFNYKGMKITRSSRTTYDYSQDDKWNDLDKEVKKAEKRRAERETFLKALKEPMYSTEDGSEIHPPITKTSEFLKLEWGE